MAAQTTINNYNTRAAVLSTRPLKKVSQTGLKSSVAIRQSFPSSARRQLFAIRAQASSAATSETESTTKAAKPADGKDEFYEVYLDKPLGIKFARGWEDGGVYVVASDPAKGNTSDLVSPGDKVVQVSASFGSDVWDAINWGQTIYAIKTRNGQVYLKFKKNYGDMSALEPEGELTAYEKMFKAERAGGNYGAGTMEVQTRNYNLRREADRKRREMFDEALAKFKKGQVEESLIDFENVLALEPQLYIGDDFARVTDIYRVTQYNIACCYAALKQIDNGLDALNASLAAGYEDFDKVRKDPNLAALRAEKERFRAIIDQYDEPIINEAALSAIKNLFSFGKK